MFLIEWLACRITLDRIENVAPRGPDRLQRRVAIDAPEEKLRDHRTSALGGIGCEAVVETSVWRMASSWKRKMDGTVVPQ